MVIQVLSRMILTSLNISEVPARTYVSTYIYQVQALSIFLEILDAQRDCFFLHVLERFSYNRVANDIESYIGSHFYLLMLWYACSAKYIERISKKLFENKNTYIYIFFSTPVHINKQMQSHFENIYIYMQSIFAHTCRKCGRLSF